MGSEMAIGIENLQLSATQEKIVGLLSSGVPAVQVANACGVSESYVSQLLADEEIKSRIVVIRTEKASQYVEHDATIDTLEGQALSRVKQLMPMVMDPMKALKIFSTLNAARRKTDAASNANAQQPSVIVNLELPASASVHFKLTADKQVVEVEGRSMVPMPAKNVADMLRKKQTERLLEHSLEKPAEKLVTPALIDQI